MINNIIMSAEQIPSTGDSFPIKTLLIVVGVAIAAAIITMIISKKKK